MPSSSGSGSRNTDPGGRQAVGSKKAANSPAGQAAARAARQHSRGSGAVNTKDDGLGDAVRAAQRSQPVAADAETTQSRKRSKQLYSSVEDDEDLEAEGV